MSGMLVVVCRTGEWMCTLLPVMPEGLHLHNTSGMLVGSQHTMRCEFKGHMLQCTHTRFPCLVRWGVPRVQMVIALKLRAYAETRGARGSARLMKLLCGVSYCYM